MGISIEHAVNVGAPPAVIWRLLIDPQTWGSWWRDCIDARSVDFRNLREGSEMELTLQPRHSKMTMHPIVDLMVEEKTLSITHRGPFLQATAAWYLDASEAGTRVKVQGAFTGIGPLVMRPFGARETAHFSLHASLRDLKKIAERMAV